MKRLMTFSYLILMLTIAFACRSQGSEIRHIRETACKSSFASAGYTLRIPPEVIRGELEARFDNLITHAQDLSRCLACESCVRSWTEWERNCQNQRVEILEGSYFPGAMMPRAKCSIPEPVCSMCSDKN